MADLSGLAGEALTYFNGLPVNMRLAISRSNLTFRTLEDIKAYESNTLRGLNSILYQQLPDPSVPSNAALDPLDAE